MSTIVREDRQVQTLKYNNMNYYHYIKINNYDDHHHPITLLFD